MDGDRVVPLRSARPRGLSGRDLAALLIEGPDSRKVDRGFLRRPEPDLEEFEALVSRVADSAPREELQAAFLWLAAHRVAAWKLGRQW